MPAALHAVFDQFLASGVLAVLNLDPESASI